MDEERALSDLKEKMTEEQRRDMHELLEAELKRRGKEKERMTDKSANLRSKSGVKSSRISGDLDRQDLGDIYENAGNDVKTLRLRKLEAQLAQAKQQAARYGNHVKPNRKVLKQKISQVMRQDPQLEAQLHPQMIRRSSLSGRNLLLMSAIVGLALLKVVFSTGAVDASIGNAEEAQSPNIAVQASNSSGADSAAAAQTASEQTSRPSSFSKVSAAEKHVLLGLDARRVELEKRRAALERKEEELKIQSQALAERVAELRTLTMRLAEVRKEKDHHYEARMEQLANVYGSMDPKEAAPLIARLGDDIALSLLERMPGKRMGQILSLIDPERAVELTKSLTDRRQL